MASQESSFQVTISQVSGLIFSGMAESVSVPGVDGEMTILAHHEPLISLLKKGTIVVIQKDTKEAYPIESGTLEVSSNQLTILV